MPRSKEEQEEERKKELRRTLQRGPDLDRFIDDKKRNFISYAQGARMFSMNYYSFVKLAKEAGANIRIKKKVVINLELIEKYLENNNESTLKWTGYVVSFSCGKKWSFLERKERSLCCLDRKNINMCMYAFRAAGNGIVTARKAGSMISISTTW